MMQVAVYGCGYGIIGVIGVDCCLCMGTGVESALTSTATSRSQSSRSARLLPVSASSPNSVKIDSASRKARIQEHAKSYRPNGRSAAAGNSRCDSDMWSIVRFTKRLLQSCVQMLLRGTAWLIRVTCTIGTAVLYRMHVPASR